MILYGLLCNILLIPLCYCAANTVTKSDIVNHSLPGPSVNKSSNGTKVPLLSEGETIMSDTLMALTKENITNPNSVPSKVVARKGVVYENTSKSQENAVPLSSGSSTAVPGPSGEKPNASNKPLNKTNSDLPVLKGKSTLVSNISNTPIEVNKTLMVKKPLILDSYALEHETVKSSQETLINDQIQSPNKDVKSYKASANNHPGMVMPVVITILLVPMFAVLGYMALRRGQEAWKNRHYKRMDFLLDGMYND